VRVVFQFLRYPEYLNPDGLLVINEGSVKIMGKIIKPFYDGKQKLYQKPKEEKLATLVAQRSKSSAPGDSEI
jgi:hypothetical protein